MLPLLGTHAKRPCANVYLAFKRLEAEDRLLLLLVLSNGNETVTQWIRLLFVYLYLFVDLVVGTVCIISAYVT